MKSIYAGGPFPCTLKRQKRGLSLNISSPVSAAMT